MFAEERPALQSLPLEPFCYYRYGERTVHLDGCVEVEAAYYGAPHSAGCRDASPTGLIAFTYATSHGEDSWIDI
jgi:hypothetical protein